MAALERPEMTRPSDEASPTHRKLEEKMDEEVLRQMIKRLLDADPLDMSRLREVAAAHGCVNTKVRSKVWPKLLAVDIWDPNQDVHVYAERALRGHPDTATVAVDVERCAWIAKATEGDTRAQLRSLERLINGVVCSHPGKIHYFQGLHDVAAVLMLTAGERAANPMVERLLHAHLRDCVQSTLDPVMATLRLLPELLEKADPEMHAFLSRAAEQEGHMHTHPSPSALYGTGRGKGKERAAGSRIRVPSPFNCHFAVSWQLTWFAHTVTDFDSICRLYDLFLSSHPLMPLYVGVAAMCASRKAILAGACEYAEVHRLLTNLPALSRPVDDGGTPVHILIKAARVLSMRVPPKALLATGVVKLSHDSAVGSWPYDWMSLPQRPDKILRRLARPETMVVPTMWGVGRAEGWGTHVNDAGDCYQGEFRGGKRHGLGRFTWAAHGETYEGQWVDDQRQGFGVNSWADGAQYSGQWEANRLEGWGVFAWPSGRKYEGAFAVDRRHGLGVMTVAGGIKSGGRFHNGHEVEAKFLNECTAAVGEAQDAARRAEAVVAQLRRNLEGLPAPLPQASPADLVLGGGGRGRLGSDTGTGTPSSSAGGGGFFGAAADAEEDGIGVKLTRFFTAFTGGLPAATAAGGGGGAGAAGASASRRGGNFWGDGPPAAPLPPASGGGGGGPRTRKDA